MRRLALAATATSLVVGCMPAQTTEAATSPSDEEVRNFLRTPQYGAPRSIRGRLRLSFETSSLRICDGGDARTCETHRNVDGTDQACWTNFARSAEQDLSGRLSDGSYWIEFTGRVAVQPGLFGHLNQYTCQVEVLRIQRLQASEIDLDARGYRFGPNLAHQRP
jgi:hypothetical protein